MRFASIDIGSNAVRLLFANVFEDGNNTIFRKESLIRVPVRLGQDAFTIGEISRARLDNLIKTIQAFKYLMEVNDISGYKACATAALREASNGKDAVKEILEKTGVKIDIVSGQQEGKIIYSNHIIDHLDHDKTYLYIDIGGGSTELSLFYKMEWMDTHSFPIGTIKILNNTVRPSDWQQMKKLLKRFKEKYGTIYGIGSGGNINKLYKLHGNSKEHSISRRMIKGAYKIIKGYSYTERVTVLGLKPDRADVIIPAVEILLFITKMAAIEKIFVPKIGLSDGLIHMMYEEHCGRKLTVLSEED